MYIMYAPYQSLAKLGSGLSAQLVCLRQPSASTVSSCHVDKGNRRARLVSVFVIDEYPVIAVVDFVEYGRMKMRVDHEFTLIILGFNLSYLQAILKHTAHI